MSTTPSLSRRSFVKSAGLAGVAAAAFGAPPLLSATSINKGKAKNLIFLVADGMGNGTLSLAHHWSLRNRSQPLYWNQLYTRKDAAHAQQDTASASSPVTDSSAAASAWGIGQRVNNGAVNVTPSGAEPEPILIKAKAAGKRVGLVTTCTVTHATPAGFAANMASRNEQDRIAAQYLEREIDLMLGGGLRHFLRLEGKQPDTDLLKSAATQGYRIARDAKELATIPDNGRLLGLFFDGHLPYAIDRENDEALAAVPSLESLFRKALANLSQSKHGFFLQVEAGRIDHAGHANDPAAILREMLEFDRCIAVASDFQKRHPDTLVIITTDHGTGGCQLNGLGSGYNDSGEALQRINRFTASFESLKRHFHTANGFDAQRFTQATGINADEKQIAAVETLVASGKRDYERAMTEVFAEELEQATAVGWTTSNHTGENVELFAFGPGANAVPRFLRNEELFAIMTEATGIAT